MSSHAVLPASCLNTQEKIVRLLPRNGEITIDKLMKDFEEKHHETIAGTALNMVLGILATHDRIKMRYDSVEGRFVKRIPN